MGGYIGSSVGNLANAAERKQTYSITTATTSLTGLAYTPTKVHVFHNGVRLVDGTDYTATNGTSITLTNAAQNGDEVVVISYPSFQTSDTVSAANGGTFAGNVAMSGTLGVTGATTLSDDLVVDTNTLFVDASANKVGIGTATPSKPLSVNLAGGGNFIAEFQNTTDATPYGIHVKDASSGANGYPLFQVTSGDGSDTYFRVDSGTGRVFTPNQPSFLVQPSSSQNNIAVASSATIAFGTERFDVGGNFASNTFTAPSGGKYNLNVQLRLENVDTAANYYHFHIQTSNRGYPAIIAPAFSADPPYWDISISVIADMDANDTAHVTIYQSGGSAQTDISTDSFFSGILIG